MSTLTGIIPPLSLLRRFAPRNDTFGQAILLTVTTL